MHYNVLSGPIISCFTRSKIINEINELTKKLYAYALAWKKTGLHAKFQVHWCYVSEFRFFKNKKKMKTTTTICENHVYLYFVPRVVFHPFFCMLLLFRCSPP